MQGTCECSHGPDVACECPHHAGGRGDDDLPPCHRALKAKAKQAAKEAAAKGPTLKVRCGGKAPVFVSLLPAVQPAVQAADLARVELPGLPSTPGLRPASSPVTPPEPPPRAVA